MHILSDFYYSINISLEGPSHNLFPHLLGNAYKGSLLEQKDGWRLGVPDTDTLEVLLRKIKQLQDRYPITYQIKKLPSDNWNTAWEKKLDPIRIPHFLQVCKKPAQVEKGYQHSIIIEPLNAFGTGHHATTKNTLRLMESLDFTGKTVLDFGCGTGILGILALKMGAEYVEFIDNDPKATRNAIGNITRNLNAPEYSLGTGDLHVARRKHYDVILANIYRNILLENSADLMAMSETLFLSGYKVNSVKAIRSTFINEKWQHLGALEENGWVAEKYGKITP